MVTSNRFYTLCAFLFVCTLLIIPMQGCQEGSDQGGDVIQAGNYTILDTKTDMTDRSRAKQNVEDSIIGYPEVDCFVGLWSYNPPAILSAVKDANKQGQIEIIAFDEEEDTLQGIKDGHIHGTIAQQPFQFGYQSVKLLTELAQGNEDVIPEDKTIYVPVTVVKQDNVDEFWQNLKDMIASVTENEGSVEVPDSDIRLAFVTNNPAYFWTIAQAGVNKAMQDFGVTCEFMIPPDGTASEQSRMVESLITRQFDGMAISPNDPVNQVDMINQAAEAMHVICQDSDAPTSNRDCYLGTNNYTAGREAGKLIKEALPDGGEIVIFVGKLDVQNARERRQGLIDELSDAPIPEEYQ